MKEEFEVRISDTGLIQTPYQDGIDTLLGGVIEKVGRASNVEWEEIPEPINARFPAKSGWSVRSAKNPALALRWVSSLNPGIGNRYIDCIECSSNIYNAIVLFDSREDALKLELKFFWELLDGGEKNVG